MAYSTKVAEFERETVQYVKITLDRCSNVFADSGSGGFCTASGTPICHYSYHTCRDRANYKKTSREYKFQSKNAPLLAIDGVIPSLVSVSALTTKLDPKKSLAVAPRFSAIFDADWGDNMPLMPIDIDKGSGNYNTETGGEYWRNLFNRNPNFRHRPISFYEGFVDDTESDLQEKFHGIIENIEYLKNGKIKVTATHTLTKLKGLTIPNATRSTNVNTLELTSEDTTIPVVDASEFKLFPPKVWALHDDGADWTLFTFDRDDATSEEKYTSSTFAGSAQDCTYNQKHNSIYHPAPGFMAATHYRIALDTGTKTNVSGGNTSRNFRGYTYDEVNDWIYAIESAGDLYKVVIASDGNSLTETLIGSSGVSGWEGLAYDRSTETLYGINDTDDDLYTINTTTASATSVGDIGSGTWNGLAYDIQEDTLYTYDTGGTDLYSVDPQTATATLIGDPGISGGNNVTGLTMIGKKSYIKIEDSNQGHEYLEMTGKSDLLNELYVVRNALYGTNEHSHGLGLKVLQVAPFVSRSDTTGATGVNIIDGMLEVLMDWAGLGRNDVNVSQFETERDEWYKSVLVKRIIEKPLKASNLMEQLQQIAHADVFQAEDQKITMQGFHPRNEHLETLAEWDSNQNLKAEPYPSVDLNIDSQVSRILVYFNPVDDSSTSKDPKNYNNHYLLIDRDIENENSFNETYVFEVFMPWIYRDQEARRMGRQILRRFRLPPSRYKVCVDIKDYAIQTSDLVKITTPDFLDVFGDQIQTIFQVTHKSEKGLGSIELELLETKFTKTYGFIGHTGANDWTSATDTEKLHAYIGTGTEHDKNGNPTKAEMSDGTDGYYIF